MEHDLDMAGNVESDDLRNDTSWVGEYGLAEGGSAAMHTARLVSTLVRVGRAILDLLSE